MTTFVAPVPARARVGDTVTVHGRPVAVAHLLPRLPGRCRAARVTTDPPCGACERSLLWDVGTLAWHCPDCRAAYDRPALVDLLTEHVRAGNARRDRERRDRQIRRGAPGAAACLLHAAAHGGLLNRAAALDRYRLDGPERRALKWALRDAGDRPLPAERCREAAAVLSQLADGAPPGGAP